MKYIVLYTENILNNLILKVDNCFSKYFEIYFNDSGEIMDKNIIDENFDNNLIFLNTDDINLLKDTKIMLLLPHNKKIQMSRAWPYRFDIEKKSF